MTTLIIGNAKISEKISNKLISKGINIYNISEFEINSFEKIIQNQDINCIFDLNTEMNQNLFKQEISSDIVLNNLKKNSLLICKIKFGYG